MTQAHDAGWQYLTNLAQQQSGGISAYTQNVPAIQKLQASFPEVAGIFQQAEASALAGSPWDSVKFQSAIQGTKWWDATPAGQRQYLYTQVFDPASATKDANTMARKILDYSNTMGLHMTLQQGATMADQAITGAWDDSRIQQEIVGAVKYAPSLRLGAGTISAQQTRLRGLANDYAMPLSDATAYDWGSRIADGLSSEQSFTEYAKDQAKLAHPYWQKQLDEGMNVRQLADPYLQSAGKLLEVNPSTIDLTDPKWQFSTTDKTGAKTPISQLDWKTQLMQDPQYGYQQTDNARQAAFSMVDQLGKTFGESA